MNSINLKKKENVRKSTHKIYTNWLYFKKKNVSTRWKIFALDSINFKKKRKRIKRKSTYRIYTSWLHFQKKNYLHELIIFSRKDLRDETFLHWIRLILKKRKKTYRKSTHRIYINWLYFQKKTSTRRNIFALDSINFKKKERKHIERKSMHRIYTNWLYFQKKNLWDKTFLHWII